jgi:hypothetical protein
VSVANKKCCSQLGKIDRVPRHLLQAQRTFRPGGEANGSEKCLAPSGVRNTWSYSSSRIRSINVGALSLSIMVVILSGVEGMENVVIGLFPFEN